MLRNHDWEYEIDIAGAFTRYRCWSCQASKYERPTGLVTYSTVTWPTEPNQPPVHQEDLTEEPCCSPAFDPHIPLEDLAKAGFVPVAMVSGPVPAELTHVATVRRIVKRAIELGLDAREADIIRLEEELRALRLGHRWPGT